MRACPGIPVLALVLIAGCAAPIVPQRTKPGGAARWALATATPVALEWAPDAVPCRIFGAGVGSDGWLPDQGGNWQVTFWSASKPPVLEVTVDSEGKVASQPAAQSPHRGHTLPADWADSPKTWAATRRHQASEPLQTFEAALAFDAEPERYPGQCVWRLRFFREDGGFETHALTPQGMWLASY